MLDASPNSDSLVSRAADGDMVAMERLLLNHHDRLLRRIRVGLPLDIERRVSVEDVLQDVLADAFKNLASLKVRTHAGFIAWLNVCVQNRLTNVRKHERAIKRGGAAKHVDIDIQSEAAEALISYLAGHSRSPRQVMADNEYVQLIREAFRDLPDDYKQVLTARFYEGKEIETIAGELDRSPGAVRMLSMRALRHLRNLLPYSTRDTAADPADEVGQTNAGVNFAGRQREKSGISPNSV